MGVTPGPLALRIWGDVSLEHQPASCLQKSARSLTYGSCRCELICRDGKVIITKISHGSPAHACGCIAVGDELVAIDRFPVCGANMLMLEQRAAAGAKHSFVLLELRWPDSSHPEHTHEVVVQRSENLEPSPILFMEPTNASIGPTTTAAAALMRQEAGLGIVVTVSTSRLASSASPRSREELTGAELEKAESTSEGVRIKDIPAGSAAHVSRMLQKGDIILQVNAVPVKGNFRNILILKRSCT